MRWIARNAMAHRASRTEATSAHAGQAYLAAIALARQGKYGEASKLLQKAFEAGECSEVDALDLQARMYAQQGCYFEAESCWRKAKALDGANPAYDEALSRLRRVHHSTGRLLGAVAVLFAAVALGLLFWQVAVVNPHLAGRQDAVKASLLALQKDLSKFRGTSKEQDRAMAARLEGVDNRLRALDARLFDRVRSLPTASQIAERYDTLVAHVDGQIATLQASLERDLSRLEARRALADAAEDKRLGAVEAGVSEIAGTLTSLNDALVGQIETINADFAKRVDRMEASIQHELRSLPTSDDVAALAQALAGLQWRMSGVASSVEQMADALRRYGAERRSGKEGPTSQPATQPHVKPGAHRSSATSEQVAPRAP